MIEDWMNCALVPVDHSVSDVKPLSMIYRFENPILYVHNLPVDDVSFPALPAVNVDSCIFVHGDLFKVVLSNGGAGGLSSTATIYSHTQLAVGNVAGSAWGVDMTTYPFKKIRFSWIVSSIEKVEPTGVLIDSRELWALQCQIVKLRREQVLARELLKSEVKAELLPIIEALEARISELSKR